MSNDKKKNEDKTLSEMRSEVIKNSFGLAVSVLLAIIAGFVLRICIVAYTVKILWNEFIVNAFDANVISWSQGLAIVAVLMFLTTDYDEYQAITAAREQDKQKGAYDPVDHTLKQVAYDLLILFMAWVVVLIF